MSDQPIFNFILIITIRTKILGLQTHNDLLRVLHQITIVCILEPGMSYFDWLFQPKYQIKSLFDDN